MLGLTRKVDYALVALTYLGQQDKEEGAAVSARRIADSFGMPAAMLMNVLKDLARAGIVTATRGSHGGYSLAAKVNEVTLMQVVTAVEGPVRLTPCCGDEPEAVVLEDCPMMTRCPIREPIRRLQDRLAAFLAEVTLADLLESEVSMPVYAVGALGRP